MGKRYAVLVALLILTAALSVGCSLIDSEQPGSEGGSAASEVDEPSGGTLIIEVETRPEGQPGTFTFTGVPTGTITIDNALVVSDLAPGTYTSTQIDPAPEFDVSAARCEDSADGLDSSADPQTRTAIFNLEAGETVRCTFVNAQRATAVVVAQTEPGATAGQFLFTGVPSGTIPTGGTLVVAQLPPGTYTVTEADPAPFFDLSSVSCDDGGSATVSMGDPTTRSAIFQLDPGEIVTCVFVNTRRGTAIVTPQVTSGGSDATFSYTGVPSGTVTSDGSLVVADLSPGTYTSTQVDPAPDFELTEISCDDGGSLSESSGDAVTRSAIFNIDAGETVRCVFYHEGQETAEEDGDSTGGEASSNGDQAPTTGEVAPFDDPDTHLADFPLPDELPADAGSDTVPKAGPWTVFNQAGQMDCTGMSLPIPAAAPESGTIEVSEDGQTLIGTSMQEDQTAPVVMTADPGIAGRYAGAFEGAEQGVPVTIHYFWQVVTEEYVVGYLTSTFTSQGVTCTVYRPYELRYDG